MKTIDSIVYFQKKASLRMPFDMMVSQKLS